MAKYRKKPVVIEAEQLTAEKCREHAGLSVPFMDKQGSLKYIDYGTDFALIGTLEGEMRADIGDYIITGINGEKYPCKPDIFEKTYEKVDEHAQS